MPPAVDVYVVDPAEDFFAKYLPASGVLEMQVYPGEVLSPGHAPGGTRFVHHSTSLANAH
jgi:hypothetical protein